MTSRRNFLKKLGLTPLVVALTPKGLIPPVEETVPEPIKTVPLSHLSPGVMVSGGAWHW